MSSQDSGKAASAVGAGVAVAGAALAISPVGLVIVAGTALFGGLGYLMVKKFNNVTIEGKHKDSSIK
jgi:O-acetylhomoserine/O-acetylserine sulfhydrylase-like pyridoxal-dependent enzyme